MPAGDRTGPLGLGPMTGRAAGYCSGFPGPGYMNRAIGGPTMRAAYPGWGDANAMTPWGRPMGYGPFGRGPVGWFGRGFGRGGGRGFGRGRGRGRGRFGW